MTRTHDTHGPHEQNGWPMVDDHPSAPAPVTVIGRTGSAQSYAVREFLRAIGQTLSAIGEGAIAVTFTHRYLADG